MKKICLFLFCCMTLASVGYSQKTLKTDNIYSIPVGNEMGLVREYTNDEILTFIEASGWQSNYKENVSIVPKIIARLSREALTQYQVEAKNVWYRGLKNNTTEELRKGIVGKYGAIDATNFKKFGILLLILEKIDSGVKYTQ